MRKIYNRQTVKEVHLADEPRDSNGRIIHSSTFPSLGMVMRVKSFKVDVTAPLQNFYDVLITDELRLAGGEYSILPSSINSVHEDDTIEFSIIDKDNVLGYFPYYGLTVGNDILELEKFLEDDPVMMGDPTTGYHTKILPPTLLGNSIIAGLYMRYSYESHGSQPLEYYAKIHYYN